ncbi:MAG TPA: hypothetical protein VLM89_13490 [Phycisphaerae bacterium]|nr:hypothetical protein [Phycisphaerae bacterium]
MTLIQSAIDTFRDATEQNLEDPIREGSLLRFPDYTQVVMTGDLHGHQRNFEKLVKYCQLETTPTRHVLLHEMIHAEPDGPGAVDRSVELLLNAARWKNFFPEQVHFLQSNHELAQLQSHQITKGGRVVTDDFERGVAEALGSSQIDAALDAINDFIESFPLAGRSPNRIFFSHSLPDSFALGGFDPSCVHQPATELDLSEGGSAYQLVWGRRHTPEVVQRLRQAYDADFFLIGHQPQEFGYTVVLDRIIILASDNNHGVYLPVDCRKFYDVEGLIDRIRPLVGVL